MRPHQIIFIVDGPIIGWQKHDSKRLHRKIEMTKEEEEAEGPSPSQEEPLLSQNNETHGLKATVVMKAHRINVNEIQKSFFKKYSPSAVDVQWENISYSVSMGWFKEKKRIIKGHFGKARSGEMTAILGPSGAGKTTLLKILAGYTFRNISGLVTLSERSEMQNVHRRLSCYIMQESIVYPYLTVREVLEIAARLQMPPQSINDHREIASEVIGALGLTECQNTTCNHLSGGERKRLSIAQELVSNPPVLFLDEPTSGLDSTACLDLVRLLKQLSDNGHTIICTIHQPSASVLALFDNLYVMSRGECVYQDSVAALLPFLESQGLRCPQYHNPADYIMDVVSCFYGDYNEQFAKIVTSKSIGNKTDHFTEELVAINHRGSMINGLNLGHVKFKNIAPNPLTQFHVILYRTYISILRNPLLTHVRLVLHVVIGLLIGAVYWKIGEDGSMIIRNTSFILCSQLFAMYTAMAPTLVTFPSETSIFLREQVNNWYSPITYYIAKTVADIPFQIIFAVIFATLVYFMAGQPPELFRFGMFLLLAIMITLVAQSFGLVIGAATSIEVALFMAPFITAIIILFSNYCLNLSTVSPYFRWIAYLSYFRYAFEATMKIIYGFDREELYCPDTQICYLADPGEYLQFMGLSDINVWFDILALGCFVLAVRTIGYGVLRWKIHFRK